jgi:hypothetical protein
MAMTAASTPRPFHPTAPLPTIAVPPMPVLGIADLDAWDDAIRDLDAALRDATHARRQIDAAARRMALAEAAVTLAVEGKNAETRKAALALALDDDPDYRDARADHDDAVDGLRHAERRVTTLKERCRLLRAALALAAGRDDG